MQTKFAFEDFLKVLILNIILYGVMLTLFHFSPGITGYLESIHPSSNFVITYALQLFILFLPLWFFVIRKHKTSLKDFGFLKISPKKLILTVLGAYLIYIVVLVGINLFMSSTAVDIPGFEPQESYIPFFGDDTLGMLVAVIFIVFLAPFLEEWLFRGFIYRIFTKTFPLWVGSLGTAALFALVHFQPGTFFPLFILGLVLNIVYQRTGSVWTSTALHMLNNGIALSAEIVLHFNPELLKDLDQTMAFLSLHIPLF